MEPLPLQRWHITIKTPHPTLPIPTYWDTTTTPMTFDQAYITALDYKNKTPNSTISGLYEILEGLICVTSTI